MKKLILTILLTTMPACAFENYMIISESPVKSIMVQNETVLNANPVFTIDNEKKIIIVTPLKQGKSKIILMLADGEKQVDVSITNNTTKLSPQAGLHYYMMELPPSNTPFEKLDAPPIWEGK